jgi:hypothetical protein
VASSLVGKMEIERERESEREICLGCFVENGFSPTLDRSRLSYLFATEQGSADE